MVDNYLVRDATFIETKALPASAGSVYSGAMDSGLRNTRGAELAQMELLISAPALTTTELPDTETMKYDVQMDTVSNFASPTTIAKEVIVQTGAGGAGDAAATCRYKLPTDVQRYVRVAATGSTSIGDCSGKSLTAEFLF